MGFAEGAGAGADEGEEQTLEEGGGLVKGFLEGFVQVDIELLGLVYVFTDAGEQDVVNKGLGEGRAGRGEELGCFVGGVCGPGVWAGDAEESVPLWEGRENLERLGKFARLVAGEDEADSVRMWLVIDIE